MKKMLKGLSYQNEDHYDDMCKKLKSYKSLTKKQNLINQRINREFFYYNPIYKDLLIKKDHLMREALAARKTLMERGKDFG
jgi:hypothetical protein